jgi:hypothetical protein
MKYSGKEIEIIIKALTEYENAHYNSNDEQWQRTINKLLKYFKGGAKCI